MINVVNEENSLYTLIIGILLSKIERTRERERVSDKTKKYSSEKQINKNNNNFRMQILTNIV